MTGNWFNHALRRGPWQSQRQATALITLGFFVTLIIGGLYLSQAASASTTGRQLELLITQRNQLEQYNEQLRAEIARLRTVSRLRDRARQLGFVDAGREQIEYMVVPGYTPRRQQEALIQQQAARVEATTPVYEESFADWLQQQWNAFINSPQPTLPDAENDG
jgi:hypothetical protein